VLAQKTSENGTPWPRSAATAWAAGIRLPRQMPTKSTPTQVTYPAPDSRMALSKSDI
jgi:hypothetical protein